MTDQLSPVVDKALQQALVDLTDLSLLGKQAHWNIQGSRFRALHLQLDEIVEEVRVGADDVAERLAALGGTPDGRAATVAAQTGLKQIEAGVLKVDDVYPQFEELLMGASDRIKATLDAVDEVDHLTNDLLIGIARGLEKQAWMLRSASRAEEPFCRAGRRASGWPSSGVTPFSAAGEHAAAASEHSNTRGGGTDDSRFRPLRGRPGGTRTHNLRIKSPRLYH